MNPVTREVLTVKGGPKSAARRLIVISGGFEKKNEPTSIRAGRVVPQLTLAEIQEHQSRIAFEQEQLSNKWRGVRDDLAEGATIEQGPIRAWLETRFYFTRGKKKSRTRLRVF